MSLLEDRIALLEEMLLTAAGDVHARAQAIMYEDNLSHVSAGFAVAIDAFRQWKAIALPKPHNEKPLDMPREEGGCA